MGDRALLGCGLVSSLLYAAAVLAGGLASPGYSHVSQAISELAATGAPSRAMMVGPFLLYNLLLIVFGIGVARASYRTSGLRRAGLAFMALGATGIVASFFPMHVRGTVHDFSDTMHVALTAVTVALTVVAIASASGSFDTPFRIYSLATIAMVLFFGALAGLDAPRLDAGLATPFLGLTERLCIGAWLAWSAALSVLLMRADRDAVRYWNLAPARANRAP